MQGIRATIRALDKAITTATETHPYAPLSATMPRTGKVSWATKIYNDARARIKRPHATRILARAWLRVMRACWRDGACYDPVIHQANGKINTTADTPLAA
ncbi:hypothetical protein ABZ686_19145 [Streptomyces sp. NPDC006992]|uniref:hypothetical protein n=1 Tax=Streptomyces sp. NPDC006992 TaxID=3155601 RepID=UPI0033E4BBEE